MQLLRLSQVLELVPMSKSSIYRDMRSGLFPLPIKQGEKVFWLKSEIETWLQSKLDERAERVLEDFI